MPTSALSGGGPNWGLGATIGVTAIGTAVGALVWLRTRRTAVAAASGQAALTVVDEPTVQPSTGDERADTAVIPRLPVPDEADDEREHPTL